jgi:hypothetical protein
MILGFFGSFRSYGGFQSPEQCVLQPQDEEIVALRHQFETAKQSFLKIPHHGLSQKLILKDGVSLKDGLSQT